ncbi:hypothetical protein SLS56_006725 [Neofusicoccum ribis]|uniref:Uncharacterized protein n=1 Tax=Neofusicoccum ribis TaxID=45134 RepID=A0ABR3SPX9_9PEZI
MSDPQQNPAPTQLDTGDTPTPADNLEGQHAQPVSDGPSISTEAEVEAYIERCLQEPPELANQAALGRQSRRLTNAITLLETRRKAQEHLNPFAAPTQATCTLRATPRNDTIDPTEESILTLIRIPTPPLKDQKQITFDQ